MHRQGSLQKGANALHAQALVRWVARENASYAEDDEHSKPHAWLAVSQQQAATYAMRHACMK